MTSSELKTQIDTALNNSVADNSITPVIEATQIKSVVDYVDERVYLKTADNYELSGTPSLLPYDINYVSFSGGIGYLPTTTLIGKEILVLASSNCTIRANASNTANMFVTFGAAVSSISILASESYRFIYIGNDFWKTEKIT